MGKAGSPILCQDTRKLSSLDNHTDDALLVVLFTSAKDGNCAIYVPSKVYFTLNACHFTDLKTTLHIGFIVFWEKNLGRSTDRTPAAATPCYYTASMRQKGLEKSMEKHQEPTKAHLTKMLPRNFKKGGRFFFKRKCLQRFKNWREEPLKKFWCLRPNFATPELPIFGKAATKRKLISENRRHWNETSG